jgi:hypothetical protein
MLLFLKTLKQFVNVGYTAAEAAAAEVEAV